MKLTLSITTVAIATSLLTGCGKKEIVVEKEVVVEKEIFNFPHDLELVDRKGRTISVTLVGRSGDEVHFQKPNDSFIHRYPIIDLSNESKEIIRSMPITEILIQTETQNPKDRFIQFREDKIKQLEKEIRDLNYDLLEARGDSAKTRGINNEIKRIRLEIARERQQIENYIFERDN